MSRGAPRGALAPDAPLPALPALPTRTVAVPWRTCLAVAAAYAAGSLFSFLVLQAPVALAVLFPPAGVSLAALLLSPRRQWPWILGTVALTELAIDAAHGYGALAATGYALTNTVEPLVSALLLGALWGTVDLTRRHDLMAFLGCAVLAGPLVGGVVGATTVVLTEGDGFLTALPLFWAGDALGVLTVGGAVLATSRLRPARGDLLRLAGLCVTTTLVTALAFWPQRLPLIWLPVPVLLWVAFRHGVPFLAVTGLVFTLTANVVTALGHGPWGVLAGSVDVGLASLQLALAVTVLAVWLLAVEVCERERVRRLYEAEHESGLQLQRALLPRVPSALPGVTVGTVYRPAEVHQEVGGDWYDAFELPQGRVGLCVGDVVGHELRAAVAMGRLQAALRLAANLAGRGPRSVLEALDVAGEDIPDALCATVGYAEYHPPTGRLTYACAGHLPPLLVTPDRAFFLDGGRSAPLGVTEVRREDATVVVPDGSLLLWCSDGLVERRDRDLQAGLDDLERTASALARTIGDPQQLCDELLARMTGDAALQDDVVLLAVTLRRTGAPAT